MRILTLLRTLTLRQLIYYGEVVGVLLAWGLGLLVALDREPNPEGPQESPTMAVVSNGPAIGLPLE
ncbi:MAG: hypothetical protein AAF589_00460 [Planctomycetota bacterium]